MIEVRNLTKTYNGKVNAVDNISFDVEAGKIYGFLGPNGAGKSTTMNILTGYISATSGTVTVNGYDIFREAKQAKRCIGYLPEQPPLYAELTPMEYLRISAGLKGLPKEQRDDAIFDVMQQTGIAEVGNRLIRHLSKGYKQRVGLAQAILGNPEVLILDEPTVGLDPKQIIEIRDLIRQLGEKHTVILSSHILSEVSAVCDTVMIISHGRLIASDTPENLAAKFEGQNALDITVRGTREQAEGIVAAAAPEAELEFGEPEEEDAVSFRVSGESDLRETLFFAFAAEHVPMLSLSKTHVSLEDVFLELTEHEPEEEPEAEPPELEIEEDEKPEEEGENNGNDL